MRFTGKLIAAFMMLLVLLLMAGCAGKEAKEVPAEDLAREGLELFDRGKYYKALQTFDIIKDRFPFSRFSLLAELKSADCKFYMKEYEEAAALYEEFEKNHPTNEAVPYVVFQIGRCQYSKIDTVDRDTAGAHKSIEIFTRLVKTFPKSSYVVEAKALIKKSREFLAGHELYVAEWYQRVGETDQAKIRREYLLDNYPDTLAVTAPVQATAKETHQFEVSASWVNSDNNIEQINSYTLSSDIYFAPVDATDKPLAEAYFLNRVGSVGFSGSKATVDVDDASVVPDADGTGFGVGVIYTRPGFPFRFQAAYTNTDLERVPPYSDYGFSSNTYIAGAGYYLLDSLLTSINYQQVEKEGRDPIFYDLTSKLYGVSTKYVKLLSSSTAYSLVGGYSFMESETASGTTEDAWSASLVGDYYFTNLIGLGIGYGLARGDDESESERYLVRNRTFFTHNMGFELEYNRVETKNTSGDNDTIQFSIISHF